MSINYNSKIFLGYGRKVVLINENSYINFKDNLSHESW